MNEAASLECERKQKFKKNANIKETKVSEVPAELRQSQERMGYAVGGKEQSTCTQLKALKTPQVMDKKDSELYEVVKQLKEEIGEMRKVWYTQSMYSNCVFFLSAEHLNCHGKCDCIIVSCVVIYTNI